jgi:hypothetical protein
MGVPVPHRYMIGTGPRLLVAAVHAVVVVKVVSVV